MNFRDLLKCKSLTFDVTQEDIDNGKLGSYRFCPIAHAINREVGLKTNSTWVSGGVCDNRINVYESKGSWRKQVFLHSPESMKFAMDFDREQPVQPATFTIQRTLE